MPTKATVDWLYLVCVVRWDLMIINADFSQRSDILRLLLGVEIVLKQKICMPSSMTVRNAYQP